MAKLDPQYQKMITQIKIDADKFADEQMQTVYRNQKDHLDEIHKYLGLLFVTYAVDGILKVTQSQRSNILASLNSKLVDMAKDMGNIEINQATDILKKNYSDTYYKNAYVMDSGLNINLKFNLLKKEYIDAAVNNPVDGELFSDRIWTNKVAVADKVKQGIVDAMNGDTTIDKLGKSIQTDFNVGAYESQRLIRTENARVQSQAIDDIGKNAGCTQQMYCATLELNTCSECAELDGKYYNIDDDSKPDIPLHPNCRCLYINVPPVGWQPSVRKNNESKDIIDYEDYNKWLKNKGIDNSENSDIIDEKNLLPNYKSVEIPDAKIRIYALEKDKNKAKAFKEALGYTPENADDLISNIENNISNYRAAYKDKTKYGERYEVIMNLNGPNGKNANVLTAWMIKTGDDFPSLTSVYVTKKKVK